LDFEGRGWDLDPSEGLGGQGSGVGGDPGAAEGGHGKGGRTVGERARGGLRSESSQWIIEDQAFSPSYDLAPLTPPPLSLSKLDG